MALSRPLSFSFSRLYLSLVCRKVGEERKKATAKGGRRSNGADPSNI